VDVPLPLPPVPFVPLLTPLGPEEVPGGLLSPEGVAFGTIVLVLGDTLVPEEVVFGCV